MMSVERTTTGLIIREPTDDVKRAVLRHFSLQNPLREFFVYCGKDPDNTNAFGGQKDVIYISSGFGNTRDPVVNHMMNSVKQIPPRIPSKLDIGSTREPRSQLQKDCIEKLITTQHAKTTVQLRPGTGKEQPYSTKIPCPNSDTGYRLMGDLKVGDYVFDRKGNPTRILEIFEQGIKDVYKVTFIDGRTAYCGKEHLWTVKSNRTSATWETMTLGEMIESDKTYFIPVCKPVNYPHQDAVIDTYTVESFVKDGKVPDKYMINDAKTRDMVLRSLIEYDESKLSDKIKEQIKWLKYSLNHENLDELQITDISLCGREQCRCIMVDNNEHLYLTDNFIVTHNTFIALYSISKLGLKPLIVCPTSGLKSQWIEEFINEGINPRDIATNIYNAKNKKICVITITSIENAIRDDWNRLHQAMDDAGFGIKIIDEAHLHLKGVLKFDAVCNIKYNWYLSATLGRSDDSEDRILNQALSDADRFVGNETYEEYQKQYVQVYLQDIYYYPTQELCDHYFRYGSKGLVKSTYYNMLLHYKGGIPFINNIIAVTKRARSVDSNGKMLILVPLLEIIDMLEERIKNDPYFQGLSVGIITGEVKISEKKDMMEKDIILSTSMSAGTGIDIKNLKAVVNFDQFRSPIINEQIVGRLRDRGYECNFIDVCDYVKYAKSISNWGRQRRVLLPYYPGVKDQFKIFDPIHS